MSKRRLGNSKCAAKVEKEISCSQRMTNSEAEEWSDEPFDNGILRSDSASGE